jgi:hypothetical protein
VNVCNCLSDNDTGKFDNEPLSSNGFWRLRNFSNDPLPSSDISVRGGFNSHNIICDYGDSKCALNHKQNN